MIVKTLNPIIYSNASGDDKSAAKIGAITAGIGAAATLGAALANRQRKPLSDVETKCGKKPMFGFGKKGKDWQKCVSSIQPQTQQQKPILTQQQKKNTMLYVSVGIAIIAIVGLVIYLKKK